MILEFVLSQLCTWYRMFLEATGLMNNKAATSWTLQPCMPGVLPDPQTFCLLIWIWILSSPMSDNRWNLRKLPLSWILAAPHAPPFPPGSILIALLFYGKNVINTTTPDLCYQQSPWPKQHYFIQTVNARLLQMAKLNQQTPAGRLGLFHSR